MASDISEKKIRITLSSADILALTTTPIKVLNAPGAGKIIIPFYAMAIANNTSSCYGDGSPIDLFHDTLFGDQYNKCPDLPGLVPDPILKSGVGLSYAFSPYLAPCNMEYDKGYSPAWNDLENKALYLGQAAAAPALLACGTNPTTDPGTWANLTDGSFKVFMNGTAFNITGIGGFPQAPSMDDVAAVLSSALQTQTGMTAAFVTWAVDHFQITGFSQMGYKNSVSVLSAAGVGTDVSGAGATPFLDGAAGHGTPTQNYTPFTGGTGTLDIILDYAIISL